MKTHVAVYLASRLLGREQGAFSARELIDRVRSEFGEELSGLDRCARSQAVANVSKMTAVGHNYLWRLAPDQYRCFDPGQDRPHPTRLNASTKPWSRDVPPEYAHLLEE